MSGLTCPSNSMIPGKVTPARNISVAYVWRFWCGTRRVLIPAAAAERGANAANQSLPAAKTRQQEGSGIGGSLGTQRLHAFDNLTDKGIDRNQAFGFELAEGHVNGPLIRPERAQAVGCQIDALADSHPGVALQQQEVAREIVAAEEFLLNPLVLFRQQRAGELALPARGIFAGEQVRQGGDLTGEGHVFQQAVQIEDLCGDGRFSQRRDVCAYLGQPAKNMWVAPQLFQTTDLGMLCA